MNAEQLKSIFESDYDRESYRNALQEIFHIQNLHTVPQPVELGANDFDAKAVELGYFETAEGLEVGLYEVEITPEKRLDRNKIGLRNLMRKVYQQDGDAALIVFTQGQTWRFTYASELTVTNEETGKKERKQTDPKRYTYILGRNQHCRTAAERFAGISAQRNLLETKIPISEIEKAFSIETLTKQFYKELFDWYHWAMSDKDGFAVTYPNDTGTDSDDRKIDEHLIRLITRLMFVWFIKQKHLIPEEIFNLTFLESILRDFDPLSKSSGNYYNAILQNLFFATLNKAIDERSFAKDGDYFDRKEHYGIKSLFRNPKGGSWFKISNEEIIRIFSKVPFLNGGLFECLDKELDQSGKIIYFDGFSRDAGRQKRAFIPNCLFFDSTKGLIPLLERYNFTVEESTPTDIEVALDPELLGKVFENLLGAYNPETKETARKQSGSFYTPREIVSYMVDESLFSYLTTACPEADKEVIRELFKYDEDLPPFDETLRKALDLALKSAKILDPACGSGAFPMGILNRMVDLLMKLQDEEAATPYEMKLHLIENCIFGIDIQTIAVQISKLRFFISLICEQTSSTNAGENYGIKPLPNLETKFVAANTLIALDKGFSDRLDLGFTEIRERKDKLWHIRSQHFSARNINEKIKLRKQDEKLRKEIQSLLLETSLKPDASKIAQLKSEIEELNARKEKYRGENWVHLSAPPTVQATMFDEFKQPVQQVLKFDKNKEERSKINKLIKEKLKELEKEEGKAQLVGFEKEAAQLAAWNPYDQNSSSIFFDKEWMFGVTDGFDIIIGNPPYIQLQSNGGALANILKDQGFETFERTGDIYCLFYERGYKLLKQNGHLIFITSNKWMRAGYGESLRRFLAEKTNPVTLIDFAGQKIFDAATVDVNILLFSKSKNLGKTEACMIKEKCTENLSIYVKQQHSISEFIVVR